MPRIQAIVSRAAAFTRTLLILPAAGMDKKEMLDQDPKGTFKVIGKGSNDKEAKATTIKEALAKWEERSGEKAAEAVEVKLYGQVPPIEKMDASLSTLSNCEKLSLSTNCIEKIANLNGLKKLTILSLGRNNIKNLNGLEAVGETLEELWISYNLIEKLKGIHAMRKLRVLYMSNNLVKDWGMLHFL
ncbi:hypothetical protein scyTo_0017950 [Scyliorhinus torazame]|uniref:Dynein axonemal light chain 1 n=1 Tax=Scyliorhinus torazame TaxID=75743 RepID=A0A401Q2Y5_SCYTO|nr:hypothetical protein [Scyliorhinus torazame]